MGGVIVVAKKCQFYMKLVSQSRFFPALTFQGKRLSIDGFVLAEV